MTGEDALALLLGRIGAARDGAVFIDDAEVQEWPPKTVGTMKAAGLLSPASPAANVVCPGCERQCTMPVHVLLAAAAPAEAFVVCDKEPDINRVPIEPDSLKRWHASGEAVAALLARLLNLRRTVASTADRRWEVGAFKGRKQSNHLVLVADGDLKLSLGGHIVALDDVLALKGDKFIPKSRVLIECVDHPAAGGAGRESIEQRRERISRRIEELKRQERRDFLKTVAAEENLSVSRIKQMLSRTSGTIPKDQKPKE